MAHEVEARMMNEMRTRLDMMIRWIEDEDADDIARERREEDYDDDGEDEGEEPEPIGA